MTDSSQLYTLYKPSKFRYFLHWWVFYIVVYHSVLIITIFILEKNIGQVGDFRDQVVYIQQNWLSISIVNAVCVGAILLCYGFLFSWLNTIKISKEVIEGPISLSTPRIVEHLKMVDRGRTMKKHIFHRFLMYRTIYFVDGKSFTLPEYAYRPDEVRTILSRLGCE